MGTIPNHIAFIMDGNRRYAKKHKNRPHKNPAMINGLGFKKRMGVKLGIGQFGMKNIQ